MIRRLCFLFVAAPLVGCGVDPSVSTGKLSEAVGEPQSGFPTPEERLGLMAINRARSDPATVKGPSSTVFPARPPVLWSYDLSRSSRFHATNLMATKANLMHTSPCKLNANVGQSGCAGDVACACATAVPSSCANCANVAAVNTCGTDTFTRIGYFTSIATGEVAAAGYSDPFAVVDGWVNEAAGSDGHRKNLLDQGITSNTMGFGHVAATGGCWSSFDVSDSGNQTGLVIPLIATAAVKPARPSSTARYYATWADPRSGAPQSLYAVIDGVCHSLTKELGTPTLNSTWYVDFNAGSGCHSFYVLGKSATGTRATYPTTGALMVGASCTPDYVATQPANNCEGGTTTPDLAMVAQSPDLSVPSTSRDMAVSTSRDMAASTTRDLTSGGSTTGGVGDVCHAHADCQSGTCAFTSGDTGYCTAPCDPNDPNACPAGFYCGTIDTANYCLPSTAHGNNASGCDVRGGRGGAAGWVMAIVAGLALIRRRRRW